jgi:hypothetical protein
MKRWLGVFLVALLALPVTSAEEIDETISLDVDSDEAVLRFISTLTGNDAVEMRTEIDEDNGNGDGIVTMDEVARYNAESTMKFETDAPECFRDFDLATIDGLRPKRLSQLSGRVEGAQGPLSSTAPIRTTGDFTLLYATARGSTHSVQISYSKMDDFGMSMGCYFDKWSDAFSGPGNFGGDAQSVWGAYSTVPWNLPFGAARILGLLEPT